MTNFSFEAKRYIIECMESARPVGNEATGGVILMANLDLRTKKLLFDTESAGMDLQHALDPVSLENSIHDDGFKITHQKIQNLFSRLEEHISLLWDSPLKGVMQQIPKSDLHSFYEEMQKCHARCVTVLNKTCAEKLKREEIDLFSGEIALVNAKCSDRCEMLKKIRELLGRDHSGKA